MTKSTITREQLLEIIETDHVQCGEASYLARMALAVLDSESWCLPLDYLQGHKDGLEWASQLAEANHPETGDWLYDDPIELAKAIRKGPDMPPSQPALDTEPVAYTDERNLGYIDRGRETAYLWGKQNSEASDVALYRHPQPDPASEPVTYTNLAKLNFYSLGASLSIGLLPDGENADEVVRHEDDPCRASMLQAGSSPVIPDGSEWTNEQCLEFLTVAFRHNEISGDIEFDDIRLGVKFALAAAPQPQNAPQNIPEIIPDCWCRACRPVVLNDMRFVVCPDCGNKRCPRANDHRNACTGSNEPGQEGSAYPAAPQEVKGE